jgi:ABC-type spermidine/putrescine transport system permease subunit II
MNKKLQHKGIGSFMATGFCAIIVIYFVCPVLLMLVSSFGEGYYLEFPPPSLSLQWYKAFFQDPAWTKALLASVGIALFVSLIDVPIASMAAYWVERTSFPAKTGISTLLLLPAMVPVIIYAVAFYGTFVNWRFFHSWVQLAVAHAVLGLPYAFIIVRAGISGIDRDLEDAARTLGAGPLRVTLSIHMPLLKWHIIFAALVAFVVSFTDPVMAIFLTSGETATLPKKAWEGLRYGIDPRTVVGTAILVYVFLLGLVTVAVFKIIPRLQHSLEGG